MKTKIVLLSSLFCLAATAQALTGGAEAGYLVDSEEEYVAARAGLEFLRRSGLSHQGEIEIGYTEDSASGIKGDIIPVTLNYRVEGRGSGSIGFYAGTGAGVSRVRVRAPAFGFERKDNAFTSQAFAGMNYQATPVASLRVGVRYIWIDDVDFGSGDIDIGDDVAISAGIGFRF